MKDEYLKFIKWKGEYAYFKKATIGDIIIGAFWVIPALCRLLEIPEGNIILIKCPKALRQQKVKELKEEYKMTDINIWKSIKQKNRNNSETLFNLHVMMTETLSILETQFLDEVRAYESHEEEPISEGKFATKYIEFFKKF